MRNYLFEDRASKVSLFRNVRRGLGAHQLPIQLVLFAPSAGVRPELELYRFPVCSAEVKDDWGYACTFSCAFMVRTDADFFSCSKYEGIS